MSKMVLILAVVLMSCGGGMDAKTACEKLTAAGLGSNCEKGKPGGLGAAGYEKYDYDLAEPAGKKCQIIAHESDEKLKATIDGYERAAMLAGPHRYASKKRLLFVQCNDGMPADVGEKLKAAVNDL